MDEISDFMKEKENPTEVSQFVKTKPLIYD